MEIIIGLPTHWGITPSEVFEICYTELLIGDKDIVVLDNVSYKITLANAELAYLLGYHIGQLKNVKASKR